MEGATVARRAGPQFRPAHPATASQALAVSVVIPVFNEERAIGSVLREVVTAMDETGASYEVLVVDDGSTDGTGEAVRAAAREIWTAPVRLIERAEQGGAGAARKTGIRAARGEIVVMLDGDGSYPASAIPEMLSYFPVYDQVNGARTSEQGTHAWLRRPAKWFIRRLACHLTGKSIPDLNTGLKALKREVLLPYLGLVPDGFSCVTTMTLCFLANGYLVKYVPTPYRRRIGRSKFHPLKDTAAYLSTVVRIVLCFRPLRVFAPLAALVTAAGVAKGLYSFSATGSLQESDVILLVGALLTFVLGLLAEVVVAQHR